MFLPKLVKQSKISVQLKWKNFNDISNSSKIVLYQPQRLQSKLEEAFHVVQAAGADLKTYITDKM